MPEEGGTPELVRAFLTSILDGWDRIVLRVKQDGQMRFVSLGQVRDQRLVYRYVVDLLKQAAAENGLGRRKRNA